MDISVVSALFGAFGALIGVLIVSAVRSYFSPRKVARRLMDKVEKNPDLIHRTHEAKQIVKWEVEGSYRSFAGGTRKFLYHEVHLSDEVLMLECQYDGDRFGYPLRVARTMSEARQMGFGVVQEDRPK